MQVKLLLFTLITMFLFCGTFTDAACESWETSLKVMVRFDVSPLPINCTCSGGIAVNGHTFPPTSLQATTEANQETCSCDGPLSYKTTVGMGSFGSTSICKECTDVNAENGLKVVTEGYIEKGLVNSNTYQITGYTCTQTNDNKLTFIVSGGMKVFPKVFGLIVAVMSLIVANTH